jgi:hypothetical protein
MGIFNAKRNLLLLFFYIVLITTPIIAVPPQELVTEPSPTYAIVCLISFCLGVALCALVNTYCVPQPAISSETKSELEKELFRNLQETVFGLDRQK